MQWPIVLYLHIVYIHYELEKNANKDFKNSLEFHFID